MRRNALQSVSESFRRHRHRAPSTYFRDKLREATAEVRAASRNGDLAEAGDQDQTNGGKKEAAGRAAEKVGKAAEKAKGLKDTAKETAEKAFEDIFD